MVKPATVVFTSSILSTAHRTRRVFSIADNVYTGVIHGGRLSELDPSGTKTATKGEPSRERNSDTDSFLREVL